MSLKQSIEAPQNFSTLSDTMHTPARFKILKELQELKNLIKNLTCSCSDNEVLVSNYSMEDSENTTELLLTLNLFQLVIMIGLVIALMCNFYSIKEPGWKQIAMKAVMFGVIVTFWPIYLLAISIASCYSKCFKEEEENVKNFKAKYKLSNSPTIGLLEQNVIRDIRNLNRRFLISMF